MWFKVDDGLAFHRKALKAGNEAVGAWTRAGAWSSAPANLTEGYIPPEVASQIAPSRVWAKLRAAGLTEAPSNGREGEQIHDFGTYNPTAAKVRAERDGWSDRQRKARESRRDKAVTTPVSHGGSPAVPFPIPFREDPEYSHFAGARADEAPPASETPPTSRSTAPPHVERVVVLDSAPSEAKDDLLAFLGTLRDQGHAWASKVWTGLLSQGGRLTLGQRETLTKIRAELDAAATAPPPAPRGRARPRDHQVQGGPSFIDAARAEAAKPLPPTTGDDTW